MVCYKREVAWLAARFEGNDICDESHERSHAQKGSKGPALLLWRYA